MKKILFLFMFLNFWASAQIYTSTTREFCRDDENDARNDVKVKDLKVNNCNIDNCHSFLFPVFIENFDFNFDLPNKWRFDYDGILCDDDLGNKGSYSTYFGKGYFDKTAPYWPTINNNIQINNGILSLINKYEPIYVSQNSRQYSFTSGMLKSLSQFEYGIYEARIKIPSANKMWPAFWLLNKSGNYSEIDIFEFWDGKVSASICENYNDHIMSIHTGSTPDKEFNRNDKYPLNIDDYHTYRLEWDKYQVSIFVDNILKGHATKYYEGNYLDYPHVYPNCNYGTTANRWDPKYPYNCNQLQGLPDNWYETYWPQKPNWWPKWLPWPSTPSILYHPNTIIESTYFPSKDRPMNVIMNNNINRTYKNETLTEFTQDHQTMFIDWIKIYQPFCCGENKTVTTVNDFDYLSNYTGFLTGKILKVGNSAENANFHQFKPNSGNDWRDIPFYFLATDEIQINSESQFDGEVYTEMRIVENCSQAGRMIDPTSNNNTQSISGISNEILNKNELSIPSTETIKLEVFPIPTSDKITIDCNDDVFNTITSLTLVDINSKQVDLEKSHIIDLSIFEAGFYQLIIVFDNKIINKKIIKM